MVAFQALYDDLAPALHAWAEHRMRPMLHRACEAEDLVQEVWHRAVKALPGFDPGRFTFRAWVFGVAKHTLLHVLRQAGRQAHIVGADGHTTHMQGLAEVPEAITSLTKRVARDEGVALFRQLLAELPSEEQELALYCGLEGAACTTVATRLGLGVEATTKRWQRLRARLRAKPNIARLMD